MGYSKYHEDNEKITFERKFDPKDVEVLVSSPLQKKSHKCYYCNLFFESLDTRNHHVKSSHNVVGPLLLINGKIVPNDLWFFAGGGLYRYHDNSFVYLPLIAFNVSANAVLTTFSIIASVAFNFTL